jgi:hypothetical protein
MILQCLESPIDQPFVVKESDIDIFSCQEDQGNCQENQGNFEHLPLCYPRIDFEDFHSSSSSSSSSICSKSLNYDDSFVSCGDQSETPSRNSDTRKHRRRLSSQLKAKKTVTFAPQVNVRTIPKLRIKNEVTATIRMAKNKELPAEDMPKKQRRRSTWIMALTCVLDEQKRQARDQVNDPETLAKLYSSFAFNAKKTAQEMARLDAKAVQ